MNRKARIFMHGEIAGQLEETGDGYMFEYAKSYLQSAEAKPISLTLPLSDQTYKNETLFAFFDGLIPEGWLLDIAEKTWKLDPRDRMGLLLACCRDCIGAVSVESLESEIQL
ncbi:HipA N-terminal domain-containing protein [bacterium]|nr:HipA N-terminal domain-containing protein [bacterium]